jgi:hypothetical protein
MLIFPPVFAILLLVKLKICQVCKRPFLAEKGFCAECPARYLRSEESWTNFGCLLAIIAPLFLIVFFWLFLLFGLFM